MGRTLISSLVLAAMIAYAFGIWLFLLQPEDPVPAKADAVFVLAGAELRLPVAQQLIEAGVAKTLVVSEGHASVDSESYALCHGSKPKGYKLVCRTASPFSTRGEARMIGDLVSQNKWASVIVVSSRYQLYRAHILIRRCTQANLVMRGADGDTWWRKALAIPLEYAKLIRAETVQRGC